jgi:hypothetical protein
MSQNLLGESGGGEKERVKIISQKERKKERKESLFIFFSH